MKKPLLFALICLLGLSAALAQAEFYKPKTSVPENKDAMIEKVEAYLNASFSGDSESMAAIMHEDFYQFPPGTGEDSVGKAKVLENSQSFSKAWKDVSWKGISTCVKDENSGNIVVMLWGEAKGTQIEGGKEVSFMNHGVYLFKDDMLFRVFSYYDNATLSQQMGYKMVPADEGDGEGEK